MVFSLLQYGFEYDIIDLPKTENVRSKTISRRPLGLERNLWKMLLVL
jgi:hypothetical protein